MSKEICILTTKDFTIVEVIRDRCLTPERSGQRTDEGSHEDASIWLARKIRITRGATTGRGGRRRPGQAATLLVRLNQQVTATLRKYVNAPLPARIKRP